MTNSTKLESGDVVKLKSGGPEMTISSIAENNRRTDCSWFDGPVHYRAFFDSACLVKVEKNA